MHLTPVLNKSHSTYCVLIEFIDELAESSQFLGIIMLRSSMIHQQRATNKLQ